MNVDFQASMGLGGTPGGSLTAGLTWTNANTVYDLYGFSRAGGASINMPTAVPTILELNYIWANNYEGWHTGLGFGRNVVPSPVVPQYFEFVTPKPDEYGF